jgi:hypothetical protein
MIMMCMGMRGFGRMIGSHELLTAVLAAKVKCLTATLGTAGLPLINRHAANRINRHAIDSRLHTARYLGTRCRVVYQAINAVHQLAPTQTARAAILAAEKPVTELAQRRNALGFREGLIIVGWGAMWRPLERVDAQYDGGRVLSTYEISSEISIGAQK